MKHKTHLGLTGNVSPAACRKSDKKLPNFTAIEMVPFSRKEKDNEIFSFLLSFSLHHPFMMIDESSTFLSYSRIFWNQSYKINVVLKQTKSVKDSSMVNYIDYDQTSEML